jgi:hypothetical protein
METVFRFRRSKGLLDGWIIRNSMQLRAAEAESSPLLDFHMRLGDEIFVFFK